MKKFYLSVLFTIISISIFAQTSAEIQYEYISYVGHKTSAMLTIKDGNCWYSRHQEPSTVVTEEGYEFYYYKNYKDWYYDDSDKTIIQTWEYVKYPIFYGQWTAGIKWEITEETKEIAGFEVQKATTAPLLEHTHGNIKFLTAIAWFTTEIPFSCGAEGYYGLPGLIVKLEYEGIVNDDKPIIFSSYSTTLKKIEYKPVEDWNVPDAHGKITLSNDQFDHMSRIDKKWLKEQKKLLKKNKKLLEKDNK